MPTHNIIVGQKINPAKAQRARELRRRMTTEEKMLWRKNGIIRRPMSLT